MYAYNIYIRFCFVVLEGDSEPLLEIGFRGFRAPLNFYWRANNSAGTRGTVFAVYAGAVPNRCTIH